MSRPRVSLRQGVLFAVVTALTTWATLLTWRGFAIDYGEYLGPLLTLGLALTVLGAALRWLRFPVLAVPLVQLLLTGLVLVAMYGDRNGAGQLPTPQAVGDTIDVFRDAIETASSFAAPIPPSAPSIAPLLVACGALALILVDVIAGGLGRVPLSGLVFLMVYTLPVTVWGSGISWVVFVLSAAGFLFMLFLREDQRFSQWGRHITGDPSASDPTGFGVRTGSARGNALAMGSAATVAALILPVLIPTFELELFGHGNGPGSGNEVTIVNPMTDLRRDLKQGRDVPLLTVATDQRDPSYLRYSVLTNFNGQEWTTGDRSIPDEQRADGQRLPAPLGVDPDVKRSTYRAAYRTTGAFRSHWLPVPFPAASVEAPGVWKYDVSTMDFLSGENDFATDMSYSATGIQLDVQQDDLLTSARAPATLLTTYTKLPSDIPQVVRELAFEVTAGRITDFERAVTLQDWFRGPGGFTYSLDRRPGNGLDDLAKFLTAGPDGRTGYCEQFASAMAVMARTLGIPARVAVGFLRPDRTGADTFVFSSHDLHAWPELYIAGSGWVRFEPTPGDRTGQAPGYTRGELPAVGSTELPSNNATSSDEPSRGASNPAGASASPSAAAGGAGTDGGFPWLVVLVALLATLLLGVLLMVPRTLRRARREARWRVGTAETAWAELRDAATDLGVTWPRGRSPRATGEILAEQFAATGDLPRPVRGRETNPEAVAALERLVLAVEVERYAPRPLEVSADVLRDDALTCVAALRNGVSERSRRRADWLPSSLRRGGLPGVRPGPGDVESRDRDQVIEHVGR